MSQTYEESVHMMLCQYVLYKNLFVWFERKEPVFPQYTCMCPALI